MERVSGTNSGCRVCGWLCAAEGGGEYNKLQYNVRRKFKENKADNAHNCGGYFVGD